MTKEELFAENQLLRELVQKQAAIIEAVENYIDYYEKED
jgi:hypothetical protein